MTTNAKSHKVTLIPGDGIGPEVTQAVVRILEATGVKFDWSATPPAPKPSKSTASTSPPRSANPSSAIRWP